MAIDFADDFGTDFSCVSDLDPSLQLVDGQKMVAQSVARRLDTPSGGLFYDRSYGFDLKQFVNAPAREDIVASAVEREAIADDRVDDATATVELKEQGEEGVAIEEVGDLTIELDIVTSEDETFPLTLNVSDLTVEILNENSLI